MKILENLKKAFESSFGDVFTNNTFKLFDFSKTINNFIEKDGEKLLINLDKANPEEKQNFKKVLDDSIQNDNEGFLTTKNVIKTKQIKRNLPRQKDEELLNFYKDKISEDIYRAFELSLIVRNAFNSGEDISELKRDIYLKFPKFGNNVCNLTTSDYFDYYFSELHKIMSEENNFDIEKYKKEVDRIARELPYMVFINRYKSLEEFEGEVKFKLSKLRKYGTDKLKLHAIGRDNVEKAFRISENYKYDSEITLENEVNLNKTIATIIFKF